MRLFDFTAEDRKFLLLFSGLTLLYVLPMLIANCPYNDDFSRLLIGNSWDDDGRLLPSLIVRFLVHATTVYDPAPLPLILSVPIFAWGGFMIRKLFIDDMSPYISAAIAMGFIFNPYLLRLFIYQLDSVGLALSLVLLIVPFALDVPESGKKVVLYHALCVLCIFFSMNSYQASLGFFTSLAVIELVHSVYKKKFDVIFKTLLSRVMQLVLAFIAYKLFLKLFFIANIARRATNAKMVSLSGDGLQVFVAHFKEILSAIIASLSQQQLIIFAVLFLISFAFGVYLYKKNVLGADINSASKAALFLVVLAPPVIFAFSFIHIAALKDSYDSLQILTSFSGLTAFLLLAAGWAVRNKKILSWLLAVVLLSNFGFSYLMGNLIKIESDFHQPLITSIVTEINNTDPEKDTTLYYSGSMPHSPYFWRLIETFPVIGSLDTNEPWSFKYKMPYYGCGVRNYYDIQFDTQKMDISTDGLPIIIDTYYYTIYKYNSDLLLTFKEL
ncbi:glucosyltransferase domain-containing protein [Maridesulfovibrio zosterae]|uniref:glucosyltransferase domain-containing protein n=1 Tax=Maridesulfovibrio zosterae TaxID=82171 RepID=UPI0003F92C17|nr:glucosyltransferase domain-containing protein [Maridesulfovibrio zosterae]